MVVCVHIIASVPVQQVVSAPLSNSCCTWKKDTHDRHITYTRISSKFSMYKWILCQFFIPPDAKENKTPIDLTRGTYSSVVLLGLMGWLWRLPQVLDPYYHLGHGCHGNCEISGVFGVGFWRVSVNISWRIYKLEHMACLCIFFWTLKEIAYLK